jgi:hypothetical protein
MVALKLRLTQFSLTTKNKEMNPTTFAGHAGGWIHQSTKLETENDRKNQIMW